MVVIKFGARTFTLVTISSIAAINHVIAMIHIDHIIAIIDILITIEIQPALAIAEA